MNEPLFSIVIPVYNIENYIGECIESLLNQSYGNFEAIVVDDGSTDNSGSLCDEYALKDSRIKVIHQENKGLSGARNTGIKHSCATWLLFLDGDDMLPFDALEKWYLQVDKSLAPILVGRYSIINENFKIDNNISKYSGFEEKIMLTDNLKEVTLQYEKTASWSVWKSAYKLELIKNNSVYFDEKINYSEDLFWILKLFQTVDKIQFVNIDIYIYRVNRENNQTMQTNKMMMGVVQTFNKFNKEFSGKTTSENDKFILSYLADVFLILIGQGIHLDGKALRLRKQIINNNLIILNYIDKTVTPIKRHIAQIVIKLLGINCADFILNSLRR